MDSDGHDLFDPGYGDEVLWGEPHIGENNMLLFQQAAMIIPGIGIAIGAGMLVTQTQFSNNVTINPILDAIALVVGGASLGWSVLWCVLARRFKRLSPETRGKLAVGTAVWFGLVLLASPVLFIVSP